MCNRICLHLTALMTWTIRGLIKVRVRHPLIRKMKMAPHRRRTNRIDHLLNLQWRNQSEMNHPFIVKIINPLPTSSLLNRDLLKSCKFMSSRNPPRKPPSNSNTLPLWWLNRPPKYLKFKGLSRLSRKLTQAFHPCLWMRSALIHLGVKSTRACKEQ